MRVAGIQLSLDGTRERKLFCDDAGRFFWKEDGRYVAVSDREPVQPPPEKSDAAAQPTLWD